MPTTRVNRGASEVATAALLLLTAACTEGGDDDKPGGASHTGLEEAGVDKLDLLGFDACLMANYEADELGQEILAGFEGQAQEQGTQDQITLALIDLTRMGAVDVAVDGFAEALAEAGEEVAPAVGQSEATTLGFGKNPDETQDKHLSDLGLLATAIGEAAPDVADQADAVVDALDGAVIDEVFGVATTGATGLSIYLPPVRELADGAYLQVPGARVGRLPGRLLHRRCRDPGRRAAGVDRPRCRAGGDLRRRRWDHVADPKDALLSLVLDIETAEFVSEAIYIYDEESGGYGEQTWEPTTDVGVFSDVANLTYEFLPLDPGTTIQADLTLTDFGGNSSTLSSVVEVP